MLRLGLFGFCFCRRHFDLVVMPTVIVVVVLVGVVVVVVILVVADLVLPLSLSSS